MRKTAKQIAETPSLKDRFDGLTPRNKRSDRLRVALPESEPETRTDPLAGYDPFAPSTNYQ